MKIDSAWYTRFTIVEVGEFGQVKIITPQGIWEELLLDDPFTAIREFERGIKLDV